ncbi:MAG: cytochrome c556 [Granulosicoccus sp.]|jgi:cytochrome c556
MSIKSRLQSAALLLSVVAIAGQTLAHTGAMGIVKERMDGMSLLGDHSKTVGDMLKGKAAFDLLAVEEAAQAFVTHGKLIPSLFPDTEDSRESTATEALPAIWSNWDEFIAIADKFTNDSQSLLTVATGLSTGTENVDDQSRAVRTVFFKAAKNCSACHERFRLDKD